jgi:PAS domain S-box-containing protein
MKRLYGLIAAGLTATAGWAKPHAPAPADMPLGEQVREFFAQLLDPAGFPARWYCGRWTDFHGWLYIVSDLMIWAAYFAIPFLLINFIRQRRDVPFDRLFWAFGLFIFACGATHFLDAAIFWLPLYRLSGFVRFLTAIVSWVTVWAMVQSLPRALLLRTPSELERMVQARTAELAAANAQLQEVAEQLRRREAEFSAMADNIAQLAWMAGADGRIFWYNQRWYEYTGSNLTEMEGWGWQKVHHSAHVERVSEKFRQHLQSGREWEDTFPLRRHDGEYRWFLSRALPVRDEQGRITRWFGTNTDITDMRQLQEQVQHSEMQYRVLMESIPQLVWAADAAGQLVFCDARTTDYTGVPADQWRGSSWIRLLHPSDQAPAAEQWQQRQQAGSSFEGEYRLRHHSGEYRWFLVQARLLRTDVEQDAQWFGTCTDIHEQHTLREALQVQNTELARTNRDLDTFVYAASHDLKQPAQNLVGLFDELKRSVSFHDREADVMLHYVDSSLGQLLGTIHSLSEVVQVQRQAGQLPPEPVQLQPLVAEVIQAVQDPGEATPTWELDFAAVSAVVFVRANLRSVLYNLLSNAVKYADPSRPARIQVRTELANGVPVLVVQDNGLGMNLARHGHELFHLFRRFHGHVPGSGVGLYLVHRLVEQAGGRLEVESEVGQGSTFRVYLHAN